ncbi:MAG TPA: hypothetical protein PK545_08770, partial [Deltaproteobacteria bacterium]|nr:hypothetical protein [Deltaproteobacteria bacterium]
VATATVVVLGVVWIPIMQSMSDVLYEYLQEVQGLLAPAIAAAFILGVFWRRTNAAGGLWGLAIGFVLGMFRLGLIIYYRAELKPLKDLIKSLGTSAGEQYHPLRSQLVEQHGPLFWIASVNWLHYTVFLFLISSAVMVLASFLGKPATVEQQKYTYAAATPEERAITRRSWNVWDVVHTAIALGIIILFYAYFW